MAEAVDRRTEAPVSRMGRLGLSSKLLLLTVLFVMISEVLIYVPSIANFQKNEVTAALKNATIAARTLNAPDAPDLSPDIQKGLLEEIGASLIAVRSEGSKRLIAVEETPPVVTRTIDISSLPPMMAISSAFDTLIFGGDRTIRAIGPYEGTGQIEIVFPEGRLRNAMLVYSRNILLLSIVISTVSAGLVYLSLRRLFVAPFLKLGSAVNAWAEAPDDPNRIIAVTNRGDEIGVATVQIHKMQRHVQEILQQQRHLADLGLAVSKINHDLRNLLASAQLMSDRLSGVPDPTVQRFAPKLIAALDRAINYAETVLAYGKAQEAAPSRRLVAMARLADEVGDVAGLTGHGSIEWINAVPASLEIDCDPDQMFRALLNIVRNAVLALEQDAGDSTVKRITLSAERTGHLVQIRITDTGPGVPPRAREHLFQPFQGSVRRGGTGLGLAIAAELVRAHGGTISLAEEGPGAIFMIDIPDRGHQIA